MYAKFFFGLGLAIGLLPSNANAQSFNCQQSGLNLTEHLICQNSDLAYKDEELNRLWNLLNARDRRSNKWAQRQWRTRRDHCGADFKCIENIYEQRIYDLLEIMDDDGSSGNNAGTPPPNVSPGNSGPYAQSFGDDVHSGIGRNYPRMTTLNDGEKVTLVEQTGNIDAGNPWYKIRFRGNQIGYHWGGTLCGVGATRSNGLNGSCKNTVSAPPQPPVQPSIARLLQIELKRVGCLHGAVDGVWGSGSRAALSQFLARAQLHQIDDYNPSQQALSEAYKRDSSFCRQPWQQTGNPPVAAPPQPQPPIVHNPPPLVPVMEFISFDIASDRADPGFPKRASRYWSGLWGSDVTAGLSWTGGKAQFFKGNQYIRYNVATRQADPGYPKQIDGNTWPGLWTSGIDAAYNDGRGKAYFFKGNQYTRYDISADRADQGYPQYINNNTWPGLPALGRIDSAVNAGNGKVYFFSGSSYLRYDIATDRADPGYPKHINTNTWPGVWSNNITMAIGALPGKLMLFHQQ